MIQWSDAGVHINDATVMPVWLILVEALLYSVVFTLWMFYWMSFPGSFWQPFSVSAQLLWTIH